MEYIVYSALEKHKECVKKFPYLLTEYSPTNKILGCHGKPYVRGKDVKLRPGRTGRAFKEQSSRVDTK